MPLTGSQNSAAAANYNTTPGSCDVTGMWGVAVQSATGPVPASVVNPLPVTGITTPAALVPAAPVGPVVVGVVSTLVAAANAARRAFVVSNDNSTALKVYIAFGFPAVSGSGIFLVPGGSAFFGVFDGLITTTINAISVGPGSANVTFQEFT